MAGPAPIPVDENGVPRAQPQTAAPIAPASSPIIAPNSAATSSPLPQAQPIPVDEAGNPLASHEYQNTNLDAATHLLERGALRSNPILAIPNQVFVGGQLAGDWAAKKLGVRPEDTPYEPINPLESLIHGLGADIDPDAGPAMQTADAIAPWLRMSPSQGTRAGEAPGVFNKVTTALRSEAGNLTDWALSDQAQQWAKDHHLGPLAQMLAGMAGGTVRGPVQRAATPVVRKVIPGQRDAGEKVDTAKSLDPEPTPQPAGWTGVETPSGSGYEQTSTVPPFRDVADPTSSIARFISGAGAIPFSGTGEASAVRDQKAAIARTANSALNTVDPGTTSVLEAGPKTVNREGFSLANRAQNEVVDNEQQLMGHSDAIDAQLAGARVAAAPLRAAAMAIINGDNADLIKTQAQKFIDSIDNQTDAQGNVGYGVLKQEHSTFGQYLESQQTPARGEPTIKNTLVETLSPIKDAITERMSAAAHQISPELGAAFDQNTESWKLQSARKQNLSSLTGDLNNPRSGFEGAPGGKQVAKDVSAAVAGEGKGAKRLDLDKLEAGFNDDQPVRSAVAETIAARGRPKDSKGTEGFSPSTFGEGVEARVDPGIMNWIEQKAGPEARRKLEAAASAGAGSSMPRDQNGLTSAIGKVVAAAPYVGASGAAFGPQGAVLSPLVQLLTSVSHDPDLIRTVANKNVNWRTLIPQAISHAALGTEESAIAPLEAFKYGVGQASNAIRGGVGTVASTVPEILKFLSNPKLPDKVKAPDQRR